VDVAGGGRRAEGTITLPRRRRVVAALDDTDSPTEGATWSLAYNIGKCMECENHRFLGHAIVQLHPVKERTQNCTATVIEFGSTSPQGLAEQVATVTEIHTLSKNWGVAAFEGFDPSRLDDYSRRCRREVVDIEECLRQAQDNDVTMWGGRGRIGALAALPWFDKPEKAVMH
jgi:methanogenesis imperfect marker protein 11